MSYALPSVVTFFVFVLVLSWFCPSVSLCLFCSKQVWTTIGMSVLARSLRPATTVAFRRGPLHDMFARNMATYGTCLLLVSSCDCLVLPCVVLSVFS
jgi:hypothetical protein